MKYLGEYTSAQSIATKEKVENGGAGDISQCVRFDKAQDLSDTQKHQACDNIGVGDYQSDLLAIYTQAKNNVDIAALNVSFPVGFVFISTQADFDPNVVFEGTTWQKIKSGLFLESSDAPGNEVAAGLPEIEGTIENVQRASYPTTGAFTCEEKGASGWSGNVAGLSNIIFKASDSNAIYGASTTVQPAALRVVMWERTA